MSIALKYIPLRNFYLVFVKNNINEYHNYLELCISHPKYKCLFTTYKLLISNSYFL